MALELKLGLAQHDIGKVVSQAAEGHPESLSDLLNRMAEAARPPIIDGEAAPAPALVLPIDQSEELFHSSGRIEGPAFLSLLGRLLLLDQTRIVALVTIRSDSYDLLQRARELEDIRHEAFSLPPLARGNYVDVIRRPLEILNRHLINSSRSLKFDPAIIERLTATLDEGAGRDALPLLAFTLARLYRDFHARGQITVADYDAMGGVGGSIDAAVDSALARAAKDRRAADGVAVEDMLRQIMIPRFAGIDPETGTARRRTARYETLPTEALPLVDALIEERLLTRDNGTVEPAHEALLREWRALTQWLAEDREQLIALEGVRRAAADWQANARHKDYLAHRERRLVSAESLIQRPDLWSGLVDTDHAYLRACRDAEDAARASRKRAIRASAVIVGLFFLAAIGAAWFALDRHLTAQKNIRTAQQAEMDRLTQLALSRAESNPVSALKLVLGAWPESGDGPFPNSSVAFQAISSALARTRPHTLINTHRDLSYDKRIEKALAEASGEIDPDKDIAYKVAFSSVRKLVIGGYDNGALQLWNADTGEKIGGPMLGHQEAVSSVAFSPDGARIVSGYADGTLQLWDTMTSNRIGDPIRRHVTSISSLAFPINDSTKIASGDSNGNVAFWHIDATGLKQDRFGKLHEGMVTSMSFSHDGKQLVSGDVDGVPTFVNTTTYKRINRNSNNSSGTGGDVISVKFSRDGEIAISSHLDGAIRSWDARTGNLLGDPISRDNLLSGAIAIGNNGHLAAKCDELGEIYLWDTKTKYITARLMSKGDSTCSDLFFSQEENILVSLHDDGDLRLWDLQSGSLIAESTDRDVDWDGSSHLGEGVTSLIFSTNENKMAAGYNSGLINVFRKNEENLQVDRALRGHHGEVQSLLVSSDGDHIISIGLDEHGLVSRQMRRADSGEPIGQSRRAHVGSTFSPDGMHFVSRSDDGTLHIWDTTTESRRPIQGHKSEVHTIVFSPDSTHFATGDWDSLLRIWSIDGHERALEAISGDDCSISSLSFSHDSTEFICGGEEDGKLRLWSVNPITMVGEFISLPNENKIQFYPGIYGKTVFSSDDKRIAGVNEFGEARLFDTETRTQIGSHMQRSSSPLSGVTFSPNRTRIGTANGVGAIRLWDVSYPPGNILQIACRYLPIIDGRPDTSTDGLTAGIVNRDLNLPTDCDSYDPPLPPEYRR